VPDVCANENEISRRSRGPGRPRAPVEVDIDFNQQALIAPRSMAALRRAKTTYRLERSHRQRDPSTCDHLPPCGKRHGRRAKRKWPRVAETDVAFADAE